MRARAALITVALVLATAVGAEAQIDELLGRTIVSVAIEEGGRQLSDSRLDGLLSTVPGQPLAMAAVRESITHLFSLGRFDDVQVHARSVERGVNLVYELRERAAVTQMVFRGAVGPGIETDRLRRAVVERYGSALVPGRSEEMAAVIEEELRRVGYLEASATARLEQGPTASVMLVDVVPGARATIADIEVDGDPGVPVPQLLQQLRVAVGQPYEREALARRIEEFVENQRERGYLTARLTASIQPAGEARINLLLTAAQGLRVRLVFAGDDVPANRRADLVPVEREGSVDEDLLEDSGLRIEEHFRAQGYRDATVTYTREEVDGELRITFTVRRGPQYRIARVELTGANALAPADLAERRRVQPGQPFSRAALDADLSIIEEVYRRAGFSAVVVSSTVDVEPETPEGTAAVAVRIRIEENVRTVVASVQIEGASIPTAALMAGMGLQPGQPFYLTQLAIDRDTIQLYYANRGYQTAVVTTNPGLSADGTAANVVFTVREGPQLFVEHVLIVGNQRTRTVTIERELQFKPGDPLGLEAINESQRRLASLGLFRRARITELGHGDETRRDLVVTVEEAPATTVGWGGGLEAREQLQQVGETATEQLQFAPRAFFEIGRRNLLGKNRSINLFTRVSLRPPRENETERFLEYRVIGTLREPRAVWLDADAFVTASLEQQQRSSFNFARQALNAGLGRRLTPRLSLGGNYQIQRSELFDEQINPSEQRLIDRVFPQVRLSSFLSSVVHDSRDDIADPRSGHFLSANGQIAARAIGSEVGFAKGYFTAQTFRLVPQARDAVVAVGLRVGTAVGFPRLVLATNDDGDPIIGPDGHPLLVAVRDLPASERFFAGGDTTVRGFALDQLGRPETLDKDGFPNGGTGVVILNAELRMPVRGGFGVVGFVDAGNVWANASDIDLGQLRRTVGFGIRYKSPVGPIRFDVGFKTDRMEIRPGTLEPGNSIHISLGQAF